MGKVHRKHQPEEDSFCEDMVVIRQPEKPGDPSVITINCPDKTGLGCDFCRIILFFGLSIVRGGNTSQFGSRLRPGLFFFPLQSMDLLLLILFPSSFVSRFLIDCY